MSDYSTIFIFFSCNVWKEYSSMRFISASTNISDIHKAIKTEIRQGDMDYSGLTKRAGIKLFNEALESDGADLTLLDYGYVMESENLAVMKKGRKHRVCI